MRLSLLLAASLLSAPLAARADVVQTFDLSGIFDNLTTVTGTLTVDITSGSFLGATSSYLGQTYNTVPYAGSDAALNAFIFFESQSSGTYPTLIFGIKGSPSLVNFSAGNLCSEADLCNGIASAVATGPGTFSTYLAYGFVTPQSPMSVTPEPSSFALLGAGILGVVGVARRRLA